MTCMLRAWDGLKIAQLNWNLCWTLYRSPLNLSYNWNPPHTESESLHYRDWYQAQPKAVWNSKVHLDGLIESTWWENLQTCPPQKRGLAQNMSSEVYNKTVPVYIVTFNGVGTSRVSINCTKSINVVSTSARVQADSWALANQHAKASSMRERSVDSAADPSMKWKCYWRTKFSMKAWEVNWDRYGYSGSGTFFSKVNWHHS